MDVMVLLNDSEQNLKKYEDQIIDIMVDLSLQYDLVISLYTQSTEEFTRQVNVLPFFSNIQKEGIKIYES